MSARVKKRGRPMAFAAGSPLLGRHAKRAGKSPGPAASPGPPGSKGVAALALATDESDIVLDRLGKEIVALLKEGGSKKDVVRRRLRLGINEVTKFLEATAAAAVAAAACSQDTSSSTTTTSTSSRGPPGKGERPKKSCRGGSERPGEREGKGGGEGAGLPLPPSSPAPPPAIVLFCRDVRPSRLVAHIHALVALTATPYLVLSGSSASLGRVFGCKTMAAMAICPARPPPPPLPPSPSPATQPRSPPSPDGGGDGGRALSKTDGAGVESGDGCGGGGGGVVGGDGTETKDGDGGKRGGSGVRDGDRDVGGDDARGAGGEEGGRWRDRGERDGGRGTVQTGSDGEEKQEEAGAESASGTGSAGGRAGGGGVPDDRARADEADADVDSFVEFLKRKVRVPVPP